MQWLSQQNCLRKKILPNHGPYHVIPVYTSSETGWHCLIYKILLIYYMWFQTTIVISDYHSQLRGRMKIASVAGLCAGGPWPCMSNPWLRWLLVFYACYLRKKSRRKNQAHWIIGSLEQLAEMQFLWCGLTIIHVFLAHVRTAAEWIIAIDIIVIFIACWSFQDTQSIPLQLHLYPILKNLIWQDYIRNRGKNITTQSCVPLSLHIYCLLWVLRS